MVVKTYSVDKEVAEKFKKNTPRQETSNILENLMREYLDEAPDIDIQLDLTSTELNDNQQKILNMMVEENISNKNSKALFRMSKSRGIYKESKYFGQALKTIVKNQNIPYTRDGDKIEPEEVECSCGANVSLKAVLGNDCKCIGCGAKIVKIG